MPLNKTVIGFRKGIEVYIIERIPHTNSEKKVHEPSVQGIVQL